MRALVGVERGTCGPRRGPGTTPPRASPSWPASAPRSAMSMPCSTASSSPSTTRGSHASNGSSPGCRRGRPPRSRQRAADQPVVYMVFDVLWLDGHSTCELPYTDRRTLLDRLALAADAWQTPPTTVGDGAHGAGRQRAAGARRRRGQAARQPLPARQARRRLAQGQAHPGPGARGGRLAPGRRAPRGPARLAARRLPRPRGRARPLRFAGRVGSGIDAAPARRRWRRGSARCGARRARSTRRRDSPIRCGSNPQIVVEVAFHEWTSAGVLRAPRYRGLRDDKPAADVVRET